MPVVPMFHANAWGLPYAAATSGSRLVLPGPRMTPGDLGELIASEKVTFTAGVPTIWQGMLRLDPAPDLSSVREIVCGGSAVPESLIRGFEDRYGVPIVQAWGMTETSPLASVSRPGPAAPEDADERFRLRATQGRVVPLVDFTIDEDSGGELLVRGPWVAAAYYEDDSQKERFAGGWLRTGDVAQVVDGSFIKLVDRTKDLVKSGGEWISSVELENVVMAHPKVMEAAVVAVSDDKWGERPCACVVPCEGEQLDVEELRSFLSERVAKWWIPDRIEFIDEVPKTAVGKFDKKVLRKRFAEEQAAAGESAA
jgi:fatty-acyl-CoA synthase